MLNFIKIKNFALIRLHEIEFGEGLNVLSGETGAGKSIILNAIRFALGARSDKQNIRNGENELRVEVVFSKLNSNTIDILKELNIDCEDDYLIISRTLKQDGKSDIRINGCMATLSMLKSIASSLVDFYGQFDSYELLNVNKHLSVLDSLDEGEMTPVKENLKQLFTKKGDLDKLFNEHIADPVERAKAVEILEYQIDEIEKANLKDGEEDELNDKRTMMLSMERIARSLNTVVEIVDDYAGTGVGALLRECSISLDNISDVGEEYNELSDRMRSVVLEFDDIADSCRSLADSLYYDQDELNAIEERLDTYKTLSRKYGDVKEFYANAINKLMNFKNDDEYIQKLQNERDVLNALIKGECEKLTNIRMRIAKKMSVDIEKRLAELNMKGAKFEVLFEKCEPTLSGTDDIEFAFSANEGEPVRSLSKVISGGELSRFMLAYKDVVASKEGVSTLVFDEIDAGISGDVGYKVAEKLSSISCKNQVLVVSHLPQIVSMGDQNYLISKHSMNESTTTTIDKIDEDGVIKELMRLSGLKEDSSYGYAKALRQKSRELKIGKCTCE